jgi:hypothetical protein
MVHSVTKKITLRVFFSEAPYTQRWSKNNSTSVFVTLMASEKMSNRSKNGSLSASHDQVEVGARNKSGAAPNREQLRVLL